ncbi:hypothetical protein [Staphylococcus aureus]|uniref:Acetyltransferase n=1 Tax=Staphylococcus aureus TaxID=1280 RepID=A0A6C0NCQ9_STAAU|nr:hypothetical protein [Staphylococcus aureus]QHW08670.1 Acetyltransferase [Staphylococcus aureus]RBL73788.1 hypothetical protein B7472_14150 [Staphylococcus aureus]RBL74257.1 hypothetical protein B4O96_11725 [Staphylococcus aureus]WLW33869.1 Acetyltransferase [Staphylococcus aureus]WLW33945.1 Acetyltransferase [Staphylococcus aureus]
MIKKLDSLDSESIEKISNIWLNFNLDAHDFIKHDYWIDNIDKVKKCYQIQQFTCIMLIIKSLDLLAYMSNI